MPAETSSTMARTRESATDSTERANLAHEPEGPDPGGHARDQYPSTPTGSKLATRASSPRTSAASTSSTAATSAVASGTPAQSSTSSADSGSGRRVSSGARLAIAAS